MSGWHPSPFQLGAVAVAAGLAMSSVGVVRADEQAVVLRAGEPARMINPFRPGVGGDGAGLIWHVPFLERVVKMERRLQGQTTAAYMVRTADNVPLDVRLGLTLRVIDPVRLVKTAGNETRLYEQLGQAIPGALKTQAKTVTANAFLAPSAGGVATVLRATLDKAAREYGAQVIDIRVLSAALPEPELSAAFQRMREKRDDLAIKVSTEGAAEVRAITADTQVRRARIIGESAGRDPEFYDFYRALRAYEATMTNPANKGRTTIVIGPDSDFLRQFSQGAGK